ncbi:DUF3466 family protein [Gallaecimonas mangrovi]|uniref:DUF3466 family protein n=1 Tax=Gallaecimonas mangrovi TaxID=2291597 RepID=UPI000E200BD9|nr:DUF3466 family protein [Gallaecimonas mangrovi]
MKKRALTLSLVALATTQAYATIPNSYTLSTIESSPVAPYHLTALGLTSDGTLTGIVSGDEIHDNTVETARITESDTTNDIYSDLLGVFDDDTVTDLVDDVYNDTSGYYRSLSTANGFMGNSSTSMTLVPGLASDDDLLTVTSYVYGGVDGYYFGYNSGPFTADTFTNGDGDEVTDYVRDYSHRGFMTDNNGTTYPLYPAYTYPDATRNDTQLISADDKLGGYSIAMGGNSSYIVGYSSSELSSGSETTLSNCEDSDVKQPMLACLRNVTYQYRATVWPLTNGVPGDPVTLGVLNEKTGDDYNPASYNSYGYAINSSGIVAGQSMHNNDGTWRNVATIFDASTGEPIEAIGKTGSGISSSVAYGINDNNIVVGEVVYPSSYSKYRFFVFDKTSGDITYPSTFYSSANAVAYDINNDDLVVGVADYEELPPSSTRRQHAFVYDYDNDDFQDLNDKLQFNSTTLDDVYGGDTCTAREDWVLEYARRINDDGQIAATAVTTLRDSDGNQVLDDDGDVQYVLRPVLLTPSDDTATTCEDDEDDDTSYSRKGGGSFGFLALGGLGLVGLLRRRQFKR